MPKNVLFAVMCGVLLHACGGESSQSGGNGNGGGGNEPPRVCQTDENCDTGDPCRIGACNAATRTCAFTAFDGDGDGHASIVCGGDDCDDANGNVHPEINESCNEKDDDCDGETDNGPDLLTSLQTDRENCGECGNECSSGLDCQNGQCSCGGNQCPLISECQNGQCVCSRPGSRSRQDSCNGNCVVCDGRRAVGETSGICSITADDIYNCGQCGNPCPFGAGCQNGQCGECEYSWESKRCNGNCVICDGLTDPFGEIFRACAITATDSSNCGRCGNVCAPNQNCEAGRCVP